MKNFRDLYTELSEKIATIKAVEWIDLWNSQVYNLDTERPFPAPAVFMAFRSSQMNDAGEKSQHVVMQVDVFLFFETFAETYRDSYNQQDALLFLDTLDAINKLLHASTGENYGSMRRVSYSPVDTGGAGNLYSITYTCELLDRSAQEEFDLDGFEDLNVEAFDNTPFIP